MTDEEDREIGRQEEEEREVAKLRAAQQRAASHNALYEGWAAATLGVVLEQAQLWGCGIPWTGRAPGDIQPGASWDAAKWAAPKTMIPVVRGNKRHRLTVIVDIDVSVRREGWSITTGPLIAARGQAIRDYCEKRSEHLLFVAFTEISGLPHVRVGLRLPAEEPKGASPSEPTAPG